MSVLFLILFVCGGGDPVCTIIIFVYVRIIIYKKEYQEPILLLGEIMVKYVSYPRSDHVQNISAESKYFVTFQNKISICSQDANVDFGAQPCMES